MHAIEVRGLRKAYGAKQVLRGVDLAVPRGAIHGFLGPNGAGKTTTIKILLGLLRSNEGDVRILGAPPSSLDARLRLGFMPELPKYPSYLAPRELLRFHGALHGLDAQRIRARSEAVLATVGLGKVKGNLRTFSKGMQQRLGLAMALLAEPELLVLDEPTSGLDPAGRVEVRSILAALPKAGTTVFLSSHALAEVEALCDRVTVIHNGRTRAEGPTREVVAKFTGAGLLAFELAAPCAPAVRAVAAFPFVAAVQGDSQRFRVRSRDTADHRAELSQAVTRAGGVIVGLAPEQGGLEEAFLKLTKEEAVR